PRAGRGRRGHGARPPCRGAPVGVARPRSRDRAGHRRGRAPWAGHGPDPRGVGVSAVQRDRWGRPLIVPPGGGDPVAYTRVSTLAKALDDTSNLMAWKQRVTAVGLARRQDLRTRLAGIIASHPDDPVGGPGK